MMKRLKDTFGAIYRFMASRRFFVVILLLFLLQALWLTFSAIYPMPFDEFAHIGAIQIYAEQWSPIVGWQSADTGIVGDMTREPSILYRWLMSFPYRMFSLWLSFEQVVILLRLINVAMVTGGIILFRKLLLRWGISRRVVHIVLLAFVVTPIVPFLAAHVNYDNLMFLLTPVVFWYASSLLKSNERLVYHAMMFALVGLVAVLSKQTFAPVMLITTAYVAVCVWWRNRDNLWRVIGSSWSKTNKNIWFGLISLGLVVMGGLVAERYVGNLLQYGTFRPACEVVQSEDFCSQFGPWYRNNIINVERRPEVPPYGNPLSFSQYWATRMMRGYYAVFSHTPTEVVSDLEPYGPIVVKPLLPLPITAAYVALGVGVLAVWRGRRKIWGDTNLRFALVLSSLYLGAAWLFNYSSYLKMWKAEAVQARYTLPVLILIFVLLAQAINWSVVNRQAKVWLVIAFAVTYVWGGGIAGWIIRSDDTWRWQNQAVQSVNQSAQKVLQHITIH